MDAASRSVSLSVATCADQLTERTRLITLMASALSGDGIDGVDEISSALSEAESLVEELKSTIRAEEAQLAKAESLKPMALSSKQRAIELYNALPVDIQELVRNPLLVAPAEPSRSTRMISLQYAELDRRIMHEGAEDLGSGDVAVPQCGSEEEIGQSKAVEDVDQEQQDGNAMGSEPRKSSNGPPLRIIATQRADSKESAPGRASSGRLRGRRSSVVVPKYVPVSAAQLQSCPTYVRARVQLSALNTALKELHHTVARKYKLLETPMRKLTERARQQVKTYRDLETDETAEMIVFHECDVRQCPHLGFSNSARAKLNILQHLGRIRIVSRGCYQLLDTPL